MHITRRQFLVAALGAGAAVAVPVSLEPLRAASRPAPAPAETGFFFTTPEQWATCRAICDRILPSGPAGDPGAAQADPVLFIDHFLSAFELPPTVADAPAVELRGPFRADFLSGGTAHFLDLSPHQVASWRAQLYGPAGLDGQAVDPRWRSQVGSLIPAPVGLRELYAKGIPAFDAYSMELFSTPFADASPTQQDTMLVLAGNVAVNALPLPIPSPPAAPPAAKALFPAVTVHTFQACYGLPQYSWREAQPMWAAIDWDGDTEPLGNTEYDPALPGDNAGFGEPGVYVPSGGYRERRPVSTLGAGGAALPAEAAATAVKGMRR